VHIPSSCFLFQADYISFQLSWQLKSTPENNGKSSDFHARFSIVKALK